jgi:hypothetical protein
VCCRRRCAAPRAAGSSNPRRYAGYAASTSGPSDFAAINFGRSLAEKKTAISNFSVFASNNLDVTKSTLNFRFAAKQIAPYYALTPQSEGHVAPVAHIFARIEQ